ncbi:MAG: DUF4381 domain-containing protein [Geminicoccaceae bacterium]
MSEELSKLNLVELLDLLEPIPEPPTVSLWPETVGWIWLGIALVALAAWLIRRWVLYYSANAYRRAALQAIEAAGDDASAIALILRRTALAAFPRTEVAGLYGDDWLAFLDRTYGGFGFSGGPGQGITSAPYGSELEDDDGLASLAAEWVRRHRRDGADGR